MSQQTNNQITLEQWQQLMDTVDSHVATANFPSDVLYRGSHQTNNSERFYCYDNYDRIDIPGFDLKLNNGETTGTLTVYNGSEQARAPITFEEGMQIARNFFNEYGGQMAEEIVCDWVMDGNSNIF
jgi:hypothetical protein